ncbi:hypothetical protein [Paracoccus sp. (in: a-proteobacteria)]|uniref:hypothetical protein n=1 Tax=Paracoccus sp. TaxID=267 RepID=UPI0026DFC139|nr:hypothetical protein [Paracoccus sp. (in: a-proteobacteria)]MDO5646998.1 hypothetical protein [Paracoccus sp. (in: a-proteobacteria)]
MTRTYSRTEVVTLIDDLTDTQLDVILTARMVQPLQSETGPQFRDIDLARLQLITDLTTDYDMRPDGLTLVLSLIDQLSGLRGDMRALMAALASEPPEVRQRLRSHVQRVRVVE